MKPGITSTIKPNGIKHFKVLVLELDAHKPIKLRLNGQRPYDREYWPADVDAWA